MRLERIIVENYRQFESAVLTFDSGITVLAGANNSGKTSLINLIKNIFVDDKSDYRVSDIPAKNIQNWVNWAYHVFRDFFTGGKTVDAVDSELVEKIIPKDEIADAHLMNITSVKIHVSYNPDVDDIKLFADYIMDLDEEKHDFYFLYNYEIMRKRFVRAIVNNFAKIKHRFNEIEEDNRKITDFPEEKAKNNILVKERYLKQLIVNLYVQSTTSVVYFKVVPLSRPLIKQI